MILAVLLVLLFLGVPISYAIAVSSLTAILSSIDLNVAVLTAAQRTFVGMSKFSLTAIPFFILAGNIMNQGGIAKRLVDFVMAILGKLPGALLVTNIGTNALFGAISGSAVATVAAIGGMTIPAMKDEGYDPDYSAALSSAASLLGPMIPPSITLIVYAGLTEASVQKLFLATLTPAILCTVAFLAYTLWYGKKKNLPKQPKKTAKEAGKIMLDAIWALLLPVIVLGLIFSGATTVTEAAAVSCLYSAVVSLFIYKTITFKDLLKILGDSAVSIAAIMILVGMSKATAYVVISSQMPQLFMDFITSITDSRFVVLLIINVIFLILGCLMEGNCIIVMMVPLLLTLVKSFGIDLLQFGVMSAINIYIGCITPPVGVSLLLGCKLGKTSVGGTFKAILPFFAISMVILILVTYWPSFTLWLIH